MATFFGVSAAVLARVFGAVALAWGTVRTLRHNDALHIGAAVLFCLGALRLALMGGAMLYILVREGTELSE